MFNRYDQYKLHPKLMVINGDPIDLRKFNYIFICSIIFEVKFNQQYKELGQKETED